MNMSVRPAPLLVGTALLFVASWASAQTTTLKLTTTELRSCVATTSDADGVQIESGGTALVAKGVTLSGDCGAGADNYLATMKLPTGSVTTGTAFDVIWTASAEAARCTYGGTAGASGWPVGSDACVGAACAGSHTNSVTVSSATSHSFSVTCTNASGFASNTITPSAPPQPPQPANFVLTASVANPAVNTALDVSWSVTGADSCTGSASLNGSSASLPGWTDAVPASASPRRVTPAQAGAWVLSLKCSNSHGNASSAPLNLTVGAAGGDADNCPAGRQTVAEVCFDGNLNSCDRNTNVTKYDTIWGRLSPTDTVHAFPYGTGSRTVKNYDKTKYLALKVDNAQMPNNLYGTFKHNQTYRGPNLTMAISETCGDFHPADAACLYSNVGGGGLLGAYFNLLTPGAGCALTPGKSYFLNIKATDPSQSVPGDCSGNTCRTQLIHYRN